MSCPLRFHPYNPKPLICPQWHTILKYPTLKLGIIDWVIAILKPSSIWLGKVCWLIYHYSQPIVITVHLANSCSQQYQRLRRGLKQINNWGKLQDLCGPMAVASHTGNTHTMNIIDNFSGHIWNIPLHSKANACMAFQNWHRAVTVQSGDTLHILVTDDGELVSNSMKQYCNQHSINHQLTTLYTSA